MRFSASLRPCAMIFRPLVTRVVLRPQTVRVYPGGETGLFNFFQKLHFSFQQKTDFDTIVLRGERMGKRDTFRFSGNSWRINWMRDSIANQDGTPPVRRKNGVWRVCKWPLLVGGGGLFLFGIFLIAISLPNLCGELPPPEISGPERVARKTSDSPDPGISGTGGVSSSAPTSTTHSLLNLDDFPHLSPTMRNLTQDWLDQCAETDQALAAITDPALRAQAAALLKNRGEINAFLNLPLEWGEESDWIVEVKKTRGERYQVIYGGIFTNAALWLYHYYPNRLDEYKERLKDHAGSEPSNPEEIIKILETYPVFADMVGKEVRKMGAVSDRMRFESYAYYCKWYKATDMCASHFL
ncbi:MAG TPA: hypothetical protein PLA90_18635, partial [Candidatus Sumerlaeota bacterium]|nr:hypothetical protein [Candidatus Sumerlaeota bacterium]